MGHHAQPCPGPAHLRWWSPWALRGGGEGLSLVCSHLDSHATVFVRLSTLGWPECPLPCPQRCQTQALFLQRYWMGRCPQSKMSKQHFLTSSSEILPLSGCWPNDSPSSFSFTRVWSRILKYISSVFSAVLRREMWSEESGPWWPEQMTEGQWNQRRFSSLTRKRLLMRNEGSEKTHGKHLY